jgi:hypothetical protein
MRLFATAHHYSPPLQPTTTHTHTHTLTDDKPSLTPYAALSPRYVFAVPSRQSSKLLNSHVQINGRFPYFLRVNNEKNSSNISTKYFQFFLSRSPSLSIELKTTAVTDTASICFNYQLDAQFLYSVIYVLH